jgi:hypothetical protein
MKSRSNIEATIYSGIRTCFSRDTLAILSTSVPIPYLPERQRWL